MRTLLAAIRAGAFPHVAAEAAGVPQEVFGQWLERGVQPQARDPYRRFAREVRTAAAQARLRVELLVCEKDPKFWLAHGPGRETPTRPGWAAEVKPMTPEPGAIDYLATPEGEALAARILAALEPFTEARLAVAQALEG